MIARDYSEYQGCRYWRLVDGDGNVYDVCTVGCDSSEADALSFREDCGELGGKVLSWRKVGKQSG